MVEWLRGWVRSPEVLTRPQASAQGSQTFGFPPYAIVGRDDHFDWLSYKFAKASTHSSDRCSTRERFKVGSRSAAPRPGALWRLRMAVADLDELWEVKCQCIYCRG